MGEANLIVLQDEDALVPLLEGEIHGLDWNVTEAAGEIAAPERETQLELESKAEALSQGARAHLS